VSVFAAMRKAFSAAIMLSAKPALACAACYGASDSAMARGMNWGIFTLLVIVGTVLCGIAGVGILIVKRAANIAAEMPDKPVQKKP